MFLLRLTDQFIHSLVIVADFTAVIGYVRCIPLSRVEEVFEQIESMPHSQKQLLLLLLPGFGAAPHTFAGSAFACGTRATHAGRVNLPRKVFFPLHLTAIHRLAVITFLLRGNGTMCDEMLILE